MNEKEWVPSSRGGCRKCKHYYITWDKNFPFGCRAMNFKSRESPNMVVHKSSGIGCLMFERKAQIPQLQRKYDKGHSVKKKV